MAKIIGKGIARVLGIVAAYKNCAAGHESEKFGIGMMVHLYGPRSFELLLLMIDERISWVDRLVARWYDCGGG